jgi:Asp/Glu/hydantoin racemase
VPTRVSIFYIEVDNGFANTRYFAQIPLPESTKNRDAMRERFIEVTRDLIDNHDAEIIVPMGVTMVPVQYFPAEFEKELGVPVMDALKTSIQTSEMMLRMGLTHSTKTYPRLPAS